jgi:hypothetical protein
MVERAATSLPVERRAEFCRTLPAGLVKDAVDTGGGDRGRAALERTAVSLSDDGGMR